ncbi:hypothetical protein ACQPZQ_34020 [Pseudonocardia sp. CA-142604]|uniref:hypothetical protein n=1 Tax=Pseudonocardia sp. CA-142604 TaxID=3240024 RepID=UPI003D920312
MSALAVDDEPTVFWDGNDAAERIAQWQVAVGWRDAWGTVGAAAGNGSSGRHVVKHVLEPLRVAPEGVHFTDCLPTYFVKAGPRSQGDRIRSVYGPFAAASGLPSAELPSRPQETDLVRRAVAEEGDELRRQIVDSGAPRIVTLGQEAADVLAALSGAQRLRLTRGGSYGEPQGVRLGGRRIEWIPLTHPGNRTPAWVVRHEEWAKAVEP